METAIGVFSSRERAEGAVRELLGSRVPEESIVFLTRSTPEATTTGKQFGATIGGYDRLAGGLCMSLNDRIEALREKHALLERAIDEEIHRPLPNQDAVHDLKRQKLRIKDEIFQLERQ